MKRYTTCLNCDATSKHVQPAYYRANDHVYVIHICNACYFELDHAGIYDFIHDYDPTGSETFR